MPYLTAYAISFILRCMLYERGQAEKIRREVVLMMSTSIAGCAEVCVRTLRSRSTIHSMMSGSNFQVYHRESQ
jgi:succinate dehydrogenase/fumarate reductase-like Fe-S protein